MHEGNDSFQIHTVRMKIRENGVIGKKYYFHLDPILDDNVVCGLFIPRANDIILSSGFTFSGLAETPLTEAQLKNLHITLVDACGNDKYRDLAPATFFPEANNGIVRTFMRAKLSSQKCYIKFQDVTGITASSYMLMSFLIKSKK